MKTLRMISILFVLSLALVTVASADVLTVSPEKSVVLGAENGLKRTLLQFDVSGMRGTSRHIVSAHIDWAMEDVGDGNLEACVFGLSGSWSESATSAPAADENPGSTWDLYPEERTAGDGPVRLDVTELVRAWDAGSRTNHGVLVTFKDLDDLAQQPGTPTLTVRYVLK